MIQETIEKLKVLQDILSQKYLLEQEIEELPRTLATKKELVSRLKKSFLEKNERFEEARRRVADLRVRLQEAEADREKYESQMDQISTAREYDALEKEIRDASEREQQYRRDLQREEKELEEQRTRLEREEAMIKTEEEELEQERAKIDSETASRQDTLKALSKNEKETIPGLDEELLFKFERIIKSKEGEGIVPIRNGVCTGCQMILPNQFVNDVREGNEILFCPYCSKIVFHTADDADLETVGFTESDEESLADLVDDDFDDDLFDEEELTDLTDEDELTAEEEAEYADEDEDSDSDDEEEEDEEVLDDDESEDLLDDEEEDEEDYEAEEIDD
jgi:predicted  nucleic acid-binding Zn-ribbon protein